MYIYIYIMLRIYIYMLYKKTSSLPLFFRQPQPRSLGDVPRAIRTDHHLALWPPSLQGERCCRGRLHLWPSCRRLWPSCRRRRLRPGHLLRPRRRSRLGLRASTNLLLHLGRRAVQPTRKPPLHPSSPPPPPRSPAEQLLILVYTHTLSHHDPFDRVCIYMH